MYNIMNVTNNNSTRQSQKRSGIIETVDHCKYFVSYLIVYALISTTDKLEN